MTNKSEEKLPGQGDLSKPEYTEYQVFKPSAPAQITTSESQSRLDKRGMNLVHTIITTSQNQR